MRVTLRRDVGPYARASRGWFAERGKSGGSRHAGGGQSEPGRRPGYDGKHGTGLEELPEDESLRLIAQAEIGRIGFTGRYGPVVVPVNFKVVDGHDRLPHRGVRSRSTRTCAPGSPTRSTRSPSRSTRSTPADQDRMVGPDPGRGASRGRRVGAGGPAERRASSRGRAGSGTCSCGSCPRWSPGRRIRKVTEIVRLDCQMAQMILAWAFLGHTVVAHKRCARSRAGRRTGQR